MQDYSSYVDDLKARREYFQRNFPMVNIALKRVDVNSYDFLKNTCPNCGYLTLQERTAFEICSICFWEDDGLDDFEENEESGPNHMSLKEGRMIFYDAKMKLISTKHNANSFISLLRSHFFELDTLISQESTNKNEIIKIHNNIQNLLDTNKIYGLENIFNNGH